MSARTSIQIVSRLRAPPFGGGPNIFPVVTVFMLLIPFLLLGSTTMALATVQVSAPVSGGEAELAREVHVHVHQDGMQVRVGGAAENTHHDILARTPESLSQVLQDIKQRRPDVRRVFLSVDEAVCYEDAVAAMEAVRFVRTRRDAGLRAEPLFSDIIMVGSER